MSLSSGNPTPDPSSSISRICCVNGEFVPEGAATISVLDHGVLYGDGVFDTLVSWDGALFRLNDHIDRFFRSMKAVALVPNFTKEELRRLTCEAIRKNSLETAYVKWILTRGSNDTPLMDPTGCEPNLIIIIRPYIERFSSKSQSGIHIKSVAIRRTPNQSLDGRIKSLNYLNLILAKMEAKAAQVDEALMLDVNGNVCEAPGYNVFVVSGRKLYTPVRDILEGITRASVIQIAESADYNVFLQDIGLYDAYTADEIFLTSTAGGIIPVTKIDGRLVGKGIPGPVFGEFSNAYGEMLRSAQWSTSIGESLNEDDGSLENA